MLDIVANIVDDENTHGAGLNPGTIMNDTLWDLAVYKEALQEINGLIQSWRSGVSDEDAFDFLYEIEGIVDEVGLE
jgi:hypothetical protein